VAEAVAALRGLSLEALAQATTANFFRLFSRAKSKNLVEV
jgi:Tat protein secretion system quality control protein TatD with DNase activity